MTRLNKTRMLSSKQNKYSTLPASQVSEVIAEDGVKRIRTIDSRWLRGNIVLRTQRDSLTYELSSKTACISPAQAQARPVPACRGWQALSLTPSRGVVGNSCLERESLRMQGPCKSTILSAKPQTQNYVGSTNCANAFLKSIQNQVCREGRMDIGRVGMLNMTKTYCTF